MTTEENERRRRLHGTRSRFRLPVLLDLSYALRETNATEGVMLSDEAITLAQQFGDRHALGGALLNKAFNLERLGRYHDALQMLENGRSIFEDIGDSLSLARSYNARGVLYSNLGQLSDALDALYISESMLEDLGNAWFLCGCLTNLGIVYDRLDRNADAYPFHQRALRLATTVEHWATQTSVITNLGVNRFKLGLLDEALAYQREALDLARRRGQRYTEAIVLTNLAELHGRVGDTAEAHATLERALRLAEELGQRQVVIELLDTQGELFLRSGQLRQALTAFERALRALRAGGFYLEAALLTRLAETHMTAGQTHEAHGHLVMAVERAEQADTPQALSRAHQLLAEWHQQRGEDALARHHHMQHERVERELRARLEVRKQAVEHVERAARERKHAARSAPRAEPGTLGHTGTLEQLRSAFEQARSRCEDLAVLVIAPDQREQEAAPLAALTRALQEHQPPGAVVGRLDTGVHALVLPRQGPQNAEHFARTLQRQLRHDANLTVSVGVCTQLAWAEADDMLACAQRLLLRAQSAGPGSVASDVPTLR